MPRYPLPDDERNDIPIFPRLNHTYHSLLKTFARRKGVPPNVLARMLIIEGINKLVAEITDANTS